MQLISELYDQSENDEDGSSLNRYERQKLREQWILGKFTEKYNRYASPRMIYAKLSESPDFEVYDLFGNKICNIEITEAVNVYYRLQKRKIRNDPDRRRSPSNCISVLERLISKKNRMFYPKHTILVIYLDNSFSFNHQLEYDVFFHLALPVKINLSQIWLIDSFHEHRVIQLC